jgi:5-methylcytosine-specific restriction protein A
MAGRFYDKRAWRRLRLAKLAASPMCELRYPGCKGAASEVDHRTAIKDGGDPLAWDNLSSACKPCHSAKTSSVEVHGKASVHIKGADAAGVPRDPAHWWNEK